MLVFLVYLSDFIGTLSIILMITLLVLSFVIVGTLIRTYDMMAYKDSKESVVHVWYSKFRALMKVYIIIMLSFVLVPSQKTFYVMSAAYAGTMVIESPEAKRIFDKAVLALESKLDSLIDPEEHKKEGK